MVGFVELLAWFNKRFNTHVNYKTFHGYVVRNFKAKIKTARKSHIKKDKERVESFQKKTLLPSAGKSSMKKKRSTRP